MVWPAVIGAAAAIGGGLLQASAARGEASKLRDWQADQYSRRYQITMNDLRAAGLNPMLAYSQGPGQVPSGAMANIGDYGGGTAGQIAAQAGMRKSAVQLQRVQTEKTREEVATAHEQARLAKMRSDDYEVAGDSIVGRQLITSIRSGKAGAKVLRKQKTGGRSDRQLNKIIREGLQKDRERKGQSVPRPRSKPAPYKYRKLKKGETWGHYFNRKGTR